VAERQSLRQKHYYHAARDLVTSNVLAGSGIDGRMLSLHEGVRKYLGRNENDYRNCYRMTALVHLSIRRSGPPGVVLNRHPLLTNGFRPLLPTDISVELTCFRMPGARERQAVYQLLSKKDLDICGFYRFQFLSLQR
jgi:hypothetical protein